MSSSPAHWKSLLLKDIVLIKKGKKPLKLAPSYFKNSVPYLDIDAIENKNYRQFADNLTTLISNDRDIFIVADGSRSGLVARGLNGAVGSTIFCITPLGINHDFLYYYLVSKFEFFNKNTTGASIPHLNQRLLMNMEIPIPPLSEQKYIADELKNKLDEYQEDFKGAENELLEIKKYKRSVLEKALNGQLTKNWRNENICTLTETSSDLKLINPDARIYEKSSLRFSLPDSWLITDAKSVCKKITDGEHSTPPRYQSGELLLSAKNVRDGYIDYSNVDYISLEDLHKLRARCDPDKNDVLIVSVGATIGRTSIVRNDTPFALVRSVLLLKPKISGEYLMYALQSPILQDFIKESCKGVAQAHLYINETNLLPIPFPSLKEQNEIIRLIKEHFETANQIEEKTSVTIKRIDDLQRAIFQIAFSGHLPIKEGTAVNKTDWFESFINLINSERKTYKETFLAATDNKKIEGKNLRYMMSIKKSIVEILESAPNNEIAVEEAWHLSKHFEKRNIEDFYEELELASKKNKSGKVVKWEFSTNQKNGVILKFK